MLVYLAGPIDAVSEDVALGWRLELAALLPEDVVCFNPPSAYLGASMQTAAAVDKANRAAIRESDVVVANLDGGPALGTMREVEYARSLDIPVIAISASGSPSLLSYDLVLVDILADVRYALRDTRERVRYGLLDHKNASGGSSYPLSDGAKGIPCE